MTHYRVQVEVNDDDTSDGESDVAPSRERAITDGAMSDEVIDDAPTGDTTSRAFEMGRDAQGIPWDNINASRNAYRRTRLYHYPNYENLRNSHNTLSLEIGKVRRDGNFFKFRYNSREALSTIVHFQLRNLVWATSNDDVYLLYQHTLYHWSSLRRNSTAVLEARGAEVGLGPVRVCTTHVKDDVAIAGGFNGELLAKRLSTRTWLCKERIVNRDNAIMNAIDVWGSGSGSRVYVCNNDCTIRTYDLASFCPLGMLHFSWPVNHATASPDGRILCAVGHDTDGLLIDCRSGVEIARLRGHVDYPFATAWHPNGYVVATGNQDTSARIYDIRSMKEKHESVAVLGGHIGAIRSLRFSHDGKFLMMAEPADFVHIYDIDSNYTRCQEIDLFGEIAGVSFSPDSSSLFIGVACQSYGSLMELERCRYGFTHDLL